MVGTAITTDHGGATLREIQIGHVVSATRLIRILPDEQQFLRITSWIDRELI